MRLPALPSEVFNAVCRLVPTTDLLSCATVNKRLSEHAHSLLYQNMYISEHERQCLMILAQDFSRAQCVRRLHISFRQEADDALIAYLHILRQALANMTHLVRLSVFIGSEPTWILNDWAASALNAYSRLRSFTSAFPRIPATMPFIRRTSN